jgi:anti-sigma factor RsiW
MSCAQEEDLTAYVDGELSALREKQMALHLATCSSCQATEALLRRTVAQLAAMPAFEPSLGMRRRVLSRIDQSPGVLERVRAALAPAVLMPSLGLAAAAMVAVVIQQAANGQHKPGPLGAGQLELAANFELIQDIDVVGLDRPEDFEVVQHLQELEAEP